MLENKVISSLLLCTFVFELAGCYSVEKISILMPDVKPDAPQTLLCTSVKLDPDKTYYIMDFEPNATRGTAHHAVLYGCSEPGSTEPVWDCKDMGSSNTSMTVAPHCPEGSSNILYMWLRDNPSFILKQDVGFKVGKNTQIPYLVMQVHYADVDAFKDGSTDNSGINLYVTQEPLKGLS